MDQTNHTPRNYNTISPSAKMLLMMKGYTDLPYFRQAAELMVAPEKYVPDFDKKDDMFWLRTMHFEERYLSINQLLADLTVNNILELSSGFSFRGLAMTREKAVHYIETDLPDLIATKKAIVEELAQKENAPAKGKLEVLPLNALDEQKFQEMINHFEAGPIAIVNEGLLMYLGIEEKEKLCRLIHDTLKQRGGWWITADIYISPDKELREKMEHSSDDQFNEFLKQHHIHENMFESFEAAKNFFNRMGFEIDKEADIKPADLSTTKHFMKNRTISTLSENGAGLRLRDTWRLKIKAE